MERSKVRISSRAAAILSVEVYNHGSYRFPLYFGKIDRPLERNVFNGSERSLQSFWKRHGLKLK